LTSEYITVHGLAFDLIYRGGTHRLLSNAGVTTSDVSRLVSTG
jgi:hypothetical protein